MADKHSCRYETPMP